MFDDSDREPLVTAINTDFTGPPTYIACVTVALGILSFFIAALTSGTAAWAGYVVGFVGVLSGIAFRWVLRMRQIEPMFLPNYVVGRIMLCGVLLSFGGIAWNAFHLAQRTIN